MTDPAASANPFEPPKASLDKTPSAEGAPALWNPNAAGLWSVFLSPVFGSVLIRKNWQALGEASKASAGAWWIGISVAMVFVAIVGSWIAFVYLIVWYFAWQKPQAVYVRERWGTDYPRKGWLVPVLIALGGWAAFTLVIWALITGLIVATNR